MGDVSLFSTIRVALFRSGMKNDLTSLFKSLTIVPRCIFNWDVPIYSVIELKSQLAKCAGVDVKNQILLTSINDIYSVPKDSTLRQYVNDDILLFLFVRTGGDKNHENILVRVTVLTLCFILTIGCC